MEWVYDNQQKEKGYFTVNVDRFDLFKGIGLSSREIIEKGGNSDKFSIYLSIVQLKVLLIE